MNVRSVVAVLASVILGTTAGAQSVQFQNGSTFTTSGIAGFATTGSMMTGLRITANFSGGSVFSGTWGDIGSSSPGNFGLIDSNWGQLTLGAAQNTNNFFWQLQVTNPLAGTLTSLTFNGGPAGVVFDCRYTVSGCDNVAGSGTAIDGTPGSSGAISFQLSPTNTFPAVGVTAIYSNLVGLTGQPPVGDLFEQFTLQFGNGNGAGLSTESGAFLYGVDTDNVLTGSVLVPGGPPPSTTVPEPSTYALMAAGLAGTLLMARRRRTEA
ncbi:PEP-CTERM sorting domain-containing protein [Gemmatimonas sp.]|uniref:PEP-CTERM sorting domain-containing protein n=1 Tax=Gemmatimonas sp. TaxID=1962908 RepID=UPI00286DCEED|nr:PEP-CTERM sorting domain-containing protein [Gemmatimonas sp.]